MTSLRLNLGSGYKRYPGFINVDKEAAANPDIVHDLESFPWPFDDNSVEEIKLEHVLEHLGDTSKAYMQIWQELWRIGKNGCILDVTVPHWNHDNFHHDPTHVRPVTPVGIMMLNQVRNVEDMRAGGNETKLGLFLGVDVDLVDVQYGYDSEVAGRVNRGEITMDELAALARHQNNIIVDIKMKARVVKPARGEALLKKHAGE